MVCKNCGKELPDHAAFCPYCGTAQKAVKKTEAPKQDNTAKKTTSKTATGSPHDVNMDKIVSGISNFNFKKYKPVIVAVAVFLIFLLFFSTRKPTVNLNKYISITPEGSNANCTVWYDFDIAAFKEDYGDKLKVKKSVYATGQTVLERDFGDVPGISTSLPDYFARFSGFGALHPNADVSNGDKVVFHWMFSDEDIKALEKLYGCKLVTSDITFTVEGLPETGE